MTEDSSPVTWTERVRSAWDPCALPEAIVLDDYEPNTPDEWDALSILRWLVGKRYDEIVGSSEMVSEMPFYYLTDNACAYFLGAYLLEISQILDRIGWSFAEIHFLSFVRDERFRNVIELLSEDQRTVLFQVILAMLQERTIFDLDEEAIAGLEMAATLA